MLPTISGKLPGVPEQKFALGATYRANRLANLHPTNFHSIQHLMLSRYFIEHLKLKLIILQIKFFLLMYFYRAKGKKRYF